MKENKIKVCPVCGEPVSAWLGFQAGLIYFCKNCDYQGPLTVSVSKKDFPKLKLLKQKKYRKK